MTNDSGAPSQSRWMDTSGVSHLLRAFKIAVHPNKLILALAALFLTAILGIVLDAIWKASDKAVPVDELARYLQSDGAGTEGAEKVGVFKVFSDFELACVRDTIESVRYGRIIGSVRAGRPVDVSPGPGAEHPARGAFANLLLMGRGVVWLITRHGLFALLFLLGATLIWAFFGGAVCRMAAMQIARDESTTIKDAVLFAKNSLLGGFFLAPLLPLLICLLIGFVMILGGLFLQIPWLGDIAGGLLFFLALFGGFLISLLLIGLVGGGSLFWPTIAAEGSDSFDAISRSFSYVYGRPLRAIWYGLIALVYGSFSWLFVRFVIWLAAASTHLFVGIGSGLFFTRPDAPNKLSALWSPPTFENLLQMSVPLDRREWLARGLIGLWVLPVLGLVWAFLASFYLSASTIIYYLLRRDVDGTDLSEVYVEEDFATPAEPATEGKAAGGTPPAAKAKSKTAETKAKTPETKGKAEQDKEKGEEDKAKAGDGKSVSLPIVEGPAEGPQAEQATPTSDDAASDASKESSDQGGADTPRDGGGQPSGDADAGSSKKDAG